VEPSIKINKNKNLNYPEEREMFKRREDEIDFLRDNAFFFLRGEDIFEQRERLMIGFCLLKYAIVLMRNLKAELNPDNLIKQYPQLRWKDFFADKEYADFQKDLNNDLMGMEKSFTVVCDNCGDYFNEICAMNPDFKSGFSRDIYESELTGSFKGCYRQATRHLFRALR
jgi:hypothetical protein